MTVADELNRLSRFYIGLLSGLLDGDRELSEDMQNCRETLVAKRGKFKLPTTEGRLRAELAKHQIEPDEDAAIILATIFLRMSEAVDERDVDMDAARRRLFALHEIAKALELAEHAFAAERAQLFQVNGADVERKAIPGEESAVSQYFSGHLVGLSDFTKSVRDLAAVYDDVVAMEPKSFGRPPSLCFRGALEQVDKVNAVEAKHGCAAERWNHKTLGMLLSFWRLPDWQLETSVKDISSRAYDLKRGNH